ncbi:MAG: isopeptide-forming domain-containing fimbrial protein [Oscillospiraceae bacterium]|nr:isopeptide-forming domain-containing fimbrial protein [Oscillospiraceae bacterium]
MKQIKRLASLVLAVMMLLSLAIPTFAAEGEDAGDPPATEGTITITVVESASGAPVTGHTYNVYQIFTGDVAADGKTLTNAAYGKNYNRSSTVPEENVTVEDAMEALEGMSGEAAAAYLLGQLTNEEPFATLNDDNSHKVENVAPGYYLIIDVTENLPENETKSAYILQVLEDVEIQSKHDKTPKTYKKIDDKNDSTGAEDAIVWDDSADHDIGDLIDFQLNAEIPVSFNAFKAHNTKYANEPTKQIAYPFTFHDVEETGLTFTKITSVYVWNDTNKNKTVDDGETTAITGYTVNKAPNHNKNNAPANCTFDVVFEDLTTIDAVQGGSVLVVEYQSRLNENAVLGKQGNVNQMCGEYRNYYSPETPSFTPWDAVIAFTYKVVVNKYDENKKPLAGAEFQLEKFVASANGTVEYKGKKGAWEAEGDPVKTEEGKIFTFTGLDDGYYRLTETETPDGYNSIDPIEFTVTAEHDIVWETQTRTDVLNTLTGDVTTGEIKFAALENNTGLTTDVENKSGTVLPETGGIGTTIFYTLGGMMVLVAVVLLVTKKRMASAE